MIDFFYFPPGGTGALWLISLLPDLYNIISVYENTADPFCHPVLPHPKQLIIQILHIFSLTQSLSIVRCNRLVLYKIINLSWSVPFTFESLVTIVHGRSKETMWPHGNYCRSVFMILFRGLICSPAPVW